MNNQSTTPSRTKKAIAGLAVMATLGFGGVATANFAGAEGYGGGSVEQAETVESTNAIQLAQLEEGEAPEAQESEERQEREGRRGRHGKGGCSFETAAETIGISEDEVKAAVEAGQTLAEVAQDNGVDPQAVVDAMVEDKAERIAEKVEAGRITQEEADEKLAEKAERIEDRVFGVDGDDTTDA